jgi:hypothetical protein
VDGDIELYLRKSLSIITERSRCNLTNPWPKDEDIHVIILKCSGLFIVTYVISEFVSSLDDDPEEQLKTITSNPDSTAIEGRSGIDGTYDHILLQASKAIGEDKPKSYANLRLVVGSIVVVFNPLSCASLAVILDMEVDKVGTALRRLHSIFIVPDSESKPIRICHKSLADYLEDGERCRDPRFHINSSDLHLELGLRCLRLMNLGLKKNIC